MRFQRFLTEGRSTPIDDEKAIDIIKTKCKGYYEEFIKKLEM